MRDTLIATVQHVDIEGGFWGLVADDGSQYEAVDLPADLQQAGLRCQITVEYPDVMTNRMWGVPVRITNYEVLS